MQIGLGPVSPAVQLNFPWLQHDALVGINAADHEVVLVDVDGDIAAPDLNRWVGHATLLCILHLNGGARICGLNGSNTDTSVTTSSGHLRCDDPTGSQITRQVELPYGQRRLAQALGPASAPVSHRE